MKHLSCLRWLPLVAFLGCAAPEPQWPVYGGNALHQRIAPQTQVTPNNVSALEKVWEYDTGISNSFQATPIVVDGVMYVSLPFNHVAAIDAASGKEIWRYTHVLNPKRSMCCGPANRGVAVAHGRVYMGTVDARLIALDARTGALLWDQPVVGDAFGIQEDPSAIPSEGGKTVVTGTSGAGLNMAPMVFDGKVIIGITGVGYGLHLDSPDPNAPLGAVVGIAGSYGERGFMAAFDERTGERRWVFETIASAGWEGQFVTQTADGVRLPRNTAQEKADLARFPDAWKYGGGSAWSTPAIDPDTGWLYFGTGNPSPQMEGSSRPGDNLYSVSLVALDARSGQYKWHYQQVPHDVWGYDVASPPVLFTVFRDGKAIPAVGQAGKTGWFYVHNRATGELIYKSEPFVPQNNMFALPSQEGTVIYPGVVGGSNWSPVSVDEKRRRVFVAGIHWPVKYTLHALPGKEGKPPVRYSTMAPMDSVERYGVLSAIDLDTGRIVWQMKTPNPMIGGVLSTASGLVFAGEGKGEFFAVDAASGLKLWSFKTDAGVNAPPVSYTYKGRQYISVAAGGNKLFGYKSGQKVLTFALPQP